MTAKIVKLFLRLALAIGFLSACADRFGIWGDTWGNWDNFVGYTQSLLPWFPPMIAEIAAVLATAGELIFAILLLVGWKVKLTANLSGWLILCFGLAMWFSNGIKSPLNASVFQASAAAFALALLKPKFLEID